MKFVLPLCRGGLVKLCLSNPNLFGVKHVGPVIYTRSNSNRGFTQVIGLGLSL